MALKDNISIMQTLKQQKEKGKSMEVIHLGQSIFWSNYLH